MSYPVQQQTSTQYSTNTPVIYTTNTVAPLHAPGVVFKDVPVQAKCPSCNNDIVTKTSPKTGLITWASCGTIIAFGCAFPLFWLGCCFAPFCIKSLKDVKHECPNCGAEVGRYNKLS